MTHPPHIDAHNVGLIDARGCAHLLYTLGARFHAAEFADWCSIMEEVVLREHIVVAGKIERFPRSYQLLLQPFIEAGVFRPLKMAYELVDLPRDHVLTEASRLAMRQGLTATAPEDANFEVSRVLGAERFTGVAATPLLRNLQHFGMVHRPKAETALWDLAAQYRSLAAAAEAHRRHSQELARLPQVSIPPIALLAVSRARHFDGTFEQIMQIRDDFAPLRNAMRQLEEQLTSGKLSPEQVLTREAEWRRRWQVLAEKLGNPSSLLSIARTSAPLLKDSAKLIGAGASKDPTAFVTAALTCLNHAVSYGSAALGVMQLRPVHRPITNYMRTTDPAMRREVARLFDTDFVRLDADMTRLATHPANPWLITQKRLTATDTAGRSAARQAGSPASIASTPSRAARRSFDRQLRSA